jgi:hypothetical protein
MPDNTLPFPSRELADKELSYDYCYAKIPPEDREKIVEMAWQKGVEAAKTVYDRYNGSCDFFAIVRKSGLECVSVNTDYVVGKQRYFSDYLTGRKRIQLYTKSIALWAKQNGLRKREAANLILSHEYFHFLEHTEIGLTSREYQVPMLILGPLKLGRTGIRALSEIGAHAFAWTYNELAGTAGIKGGTDEDDEYDEL